MWSHQGARRQEITKAYKDSLMESSSSGKKLKRVRFNLPKNDTNSQEEPKVVKDSPPSSPKIIEEENLSLLASLTKTLSTSLTKSPIASPTKAPSTSSTKTPFASSTKTPPPPLTKKLTPSPTKTPEPLPTRTLIPSPTKTP